MIKDTQIEQLRIIRQQNNDFAWLVSDFLNNCPDAITPELIKEVNADGFIPDEMLCKSLLIGLFDLQPESKENDKILVNKYLYKSLKKLNPIEYYHNPYFQNIHIPEVPFQNWKLTHTTYKPYELFVCNDIILTKDFREIPQLGFFTEPFTFPAVHENGREWMAIKPNEIETMRMAISKASGNVITFGLGLGYFAYMVSLKDDVQSITIVERDKNVISLFETFILPQFEHPEKVTIICSDAFLFMKQQMPKSSFNFAFVDLWHDTQDGLPLYLRSKKLEKANAQTTFLYWVEDSLLSAYRWNNFDSIINKSKSYEEICDRLKNGF